MNSFKLFAIGNLARNPELIAKGESLYTRLCVIGNDCVGRDEEGNARELVTSLWFTAFGALGEALAKNTRKGDQLILEARVQSNTWTDKEGQTHFDHSFVVTGFRFGAPGQATRETFDTSAEAND
jgi:single-stranded DNA-binding protein